MAALAVVLAGLLSLTTPFEALEMGNLDWRFLFRGPRGTPSPDIVLVLVEEGAELDYRSPIPREHLAQTIERLSSALTRVTVTASRGWLKPERETAEEILARIVKEGGEYSARKRFGPVP